MNEENMLSVLMYLFKHHMSDSCDIDLSTEKISQQLETLGFEKIAIDEAFVWLENLINQSQCQVETPHQDSIRIFTPKEQQAINIECQSFLLSLEKQKILTAHTREIVINQLLTLNIDDIDIGLIQWVTLMVLFHQKDQELSLIHI